MVAVVDTPVEESQAPYGYDGIYRPEWAARYLRAGLPGSLQREQPPSRRRIQGWIASGLVHARPKSGSGGSWVLNFGDLVTCQAIIIFREKGHSLQRIRRFEQDCASHFQVERPFAHQEFWCASWDILVRLGDGVFWSARKRFQTSFYERGMEQLRQNLHFSPVTHEADSWFPWPRIELRPDTQFGRPCIAGTNITTATVWSFVEAGEPVASVAKEYGLEVQDVDDAYRFEQEVRSPLDATPRLST